jgi:acetyl-CoA acetyltransferase
LEVGSLDMADFPINTHGGLLGMGAPWEAPSLFTVIEACEQLTGVSGREQLAAKGHKRAAVYGNGGVFGASAVAILETRGT